jgi:hypothetical protein
MTLAFLSQTRTAECVQCPAREVNFWTFYP